MLENQLPENLWHYTTLHAFQSMVMNDQLWATDHRFLNDSSEYLHGLTELISLLESYNGKRNEENFTQEIKQPNYNSFLLTHDLLFKEYKNLKANDNIKKTVYRSQFKNSVEEINSPFYCMSFSEKSDSLNQWMGYLDKYGGCSIGFNTKKILEYIQKKPSENTFHQCIYTKRKFIEICKNDLKNMKENLFSNFFENFFKFQDQLTHMQILCSYRKHRSFYNEKEWRLTWLDPNKSVYFETGKPHLKIPVTQYGIINAIDYITISPQGNQKRALIFVEEVLKAKVREAHLNMKRINNGEIAITCSMLPYQG